jgi:hypothetical protein
MPVKCVLGWGFNDVGPKRPGFSEVHFYLGAVTTTKDPALQAAAFNLMNARTQLMGANVRATVLRLSLPGIPRKSTTIYAVPTGSGPSPLSQYAQLSQGNCDIPNTSLAVTLKSALNQSRTMYLAGLPDFLIKTGATCGPDFGHAGLLGYQALWNSWRDLLLSGTWGFYCLNLLPNGQPAPISFWITMTAAPFNIAFVLPNSSPYVPTVGSVVHVRGALMGVTGAPRPIGNWRIKSVSAFDAGNTTFELDQSSGYQAALIQMPGTVESVIRGYQPYTDMGNLLQTTRKRGIGPVRPVGRKKPRARRQPV